MKIRSLIVLFGLLTGISVSAQDRTWTDTLTAAIKTANRRIELSIDRLSAEAKEIRGVLSPLGEGDPIRWVQSLPGVTTGADGGSAFYVRGGNMGNNLISLDGVPVYGYSHLLGLTMIIPVSVMQSVELAKGGFDGRENNFTAAHLAVETKAPLEKISSSVALNNFLLSANSEGHITKGLSYLLSARISPLTWEYKALQKLLPEQVVFDRFKADVGDLYGKIRYDFSGQTFIELAGLGSQDGYAFSPGPDSDKSLGWRNGLVSFRLQNQTATTRTSFLSYIDYFDTHQAQDAVYHGNKNHLALQSVMMETAFSADRTRTMGRFCFGFGAKGRYAEFKPGQIADVDNRSTVVLGDAFLQAGFKIPDLIDVKAVGRLNYYERRDGRWPQHLRLSEENVRFDPEYSFSAQVNIGPHVLLEGSFDRLVQYYHTLEGLPVGWSLDMIVPSGSRGPSRPQVAPETVRQGAVGIQFRAGAHCGSVGGFYKMMDQLVYYKYSQSLFNVGMVNWESQVSQGQGTSRGLEFQYEFSHGDWYARMAYTLSKTDRSGFEGVNEGKPFHARFDRTHILNAQGLWRHWTVSLILESGHWENGAAMTYPMHTLEDAPWRAEYYSGINNYHMPTVFRLDVGYQHIFTTGRLQHELNLGVCNLTNHFNPFMLYFDGASESWKEMALLPILPNFSWRIGF